MNIIQTFRIAMQSLRADRTYFWQIMISVVVGVIALETALTIGNGIVNMFDIIHENYSSSMFYICLQTRAESAHRIMPEDMEKLAADNPDIFTSASPVISVVGDFKYNDKTNDEIEILGVSDAFNEIFRALQLEQGRFLLPMDIDREQEVCVLGSNAAKMIQGEEVLGSTVKIQGRSYTVIGIAQEIENDFDYAGWNNAVYIPYSNAQKLQNYTFMPTYYENGGYFDVFYLGYTEQGKMQEAFSAVYDMREQILGEDGQMGVFTLDGWIKGASEYFFIIVTGALIIVALALFVAGAGVANVLVLAVSRRAKEIGIRKTFGARFRDIRCQFLLEAVCLSFVGWLPGALAGMPISYLVCLYVGLPFNLSVLYVLLGLFLVVGLGCVFGYAPAGKAAKMEIVNAINES